MSLPQNPLASFRSYSYYHILVMCDSTDTAESLSSVVAEEQWRHPSQNEIDQAVWAQYHKYSPRSIPINNKNTNPANTANTDTTFLNGRYCVLIDGSKDADISITNLEYQAVTASAVTELDNNTSIALEGKIEFSEPRGVSFLNILISACQSLNIDAAQAVYAVKTIFVGHSYDQIDQVESQLSIINVEPLKFMALDVSGSFSESGGKYSMEILGCQHGISRLPQYSKAADAFSIKAGNTLASTFRNLQTHIAERYEDIYACVQGTLRSADIQNVSNSAKIVDRLSTVKYEITWDELYGTVLNGVFNDNHEYVVTNQLPQQKDEPHCRAQAQVNCPPGTSIEDAIHRIMTYCPRVQLDLGTNDKSNTPRYGYKIESAYRSKIVSGQNGTGQRIEFIVSYNVKRFLEPRSIGGLVELSKTAALKNNVIEFDYIYTGKNVDILDLDVKLNLGLYYMQAASVSNSTISGPNYGSSRVTSIAGDVESAVSRNGTDSQIPVFFSTDVRSPLFRNLQRIETNTQAAYTLSKHSSFEVIDTSMTIYGNPLLLNSVNTASSKRDILPSDTTTSVSDFMKFTQNPSFVKINIRMPRTNDDIALLTAQVDPAGVPGGQDYAQPFWFQGYYYLMAVQNIFDEGLFTQRLELIGIPEESILTLSGSSLAEKASTRIDACYDKIEFKPDVDTSTNEVVLSKEPPKSPPDHPNFNVADAKVMLDDSGLTLQNVVAYDGTTQEIKNALNSAARRYNVDVVQLARIASWESGGFNKTATNPKSTAVGLFQFLKGTWITLKNGGKVDGLPRTLSDAQALPKRTDPLISSNAGAQFILNNQQVMRNKGVLEPTTTTNTYLAHFAGSAGASAILIAIQTGHGNDSLYDVYDRSFKNGSAEAGRQIKSNKLSQNITAQGMQDFAADKMSRTIIGGIKVAKKTSSTSQNANQVNSDPAPLTKVTSKTGSQQVANANAASVKLQKSSAAYKKISIEVFSRRAGETNDQWRDRLQEFADTKYATENTTTIRSVGKGAVETNSAKRVTIRKIGANETEEEYFKYIGEYASSIVQRPIVINKPVQDCQYD